MALTDDLASWWAHRVTLRRRTGTSGYGRDLYSSDEAGVPCFVNDRTQEVAGQGGAAVTSNTQVAFPRAVGVIPLHSQIVLPAAFGGRTAVVVASSVADGGGLDTPDHVVAYLD